MPEFYTLTRIKYEIFFVLDKWNKLTRKEKVEQIKQEIQEGTTIDRNRIAEKLVEN